MADETPRLDSVTAVLTAAERGEMMEKALEAGLSATTALTASHACLAAACGLTEVEARKQLADQTLYFSAVLEHWTFNREALRRLGLWPEEWGE